jgi:glutathione S-transferase
MALGTLYHCVGARSFRALWAAEAALCPIELIVLPFPPRVKQRAFLEINPLGTIPAFVTATGQLMTESMAIGEFIAACSPAAALAVLPSESDFPFYLNWVHHGEATLTFPQALILRYGRFEPPERRQPQTVDDYTIWLLARMRGLETALADGRAFLCAERLTLADISVGYALLLADYLGLKDRFTPAIAAYYEGLSRLPSFIASLEREHSAALAQNVSPIPAPLTVA